MGDKRYFAIIENDVVVHTLVCQDTEKMKSEDFVENLLKDKKFVNGRTLSYQETFKGKGFAGIGMTYRKDKQDFIAPSPKSLGGNWQFDEVKKEYIEPAALKDTTVYKFFNADKIMDSGSNGIAIKPVDAKEVKKKIK